MGGMEFNKIFAAILVAGIIAMLAGFISGKIVSPHKLHENAYKIEGVASAGGGAPVEKLAEPILAMLATADVERGQKVAKACAACHNFEKGGPNGVGPGLWNVVGGKKQNHPGFTYSGTLNTQGGDVWEYENLNKFLWNPKKYAPGTKMNFVGIKKPEDRAAVVAWLRTLSDSPKAMPGAVEIAQEEADLTPKVSEEKIDAAVETLTDGKDKGDAKAVETIIETVKDAVPAH